MACSRVINGLIFLCNESNESLKLSCMLVIKPKKKKKSKVGLNLKLF